MIELDSRYAPMPSDARAILRQKTLLGETYVELTPGSADAEPVPEGGTLPESQVSPTVQLDEIFRTFDPRHAGGVPGLDAGAGARRSAATGATSTTRSATSARSPRTPPTLVDILNRQEGAVTAWSRTPASCSRR